MVNEHLKGAFQNSSKEKEDKKKNTAVVLFWEYSNIMHSTIKKIVPLIPSHPKSNSSPLQEELQHSISLLYIF